GFTGDMSSIGAEILFKQNGSTVRTDNVLLDANGNFSVSGIELGTYDINIKVCSQLQKSINGAALSTINPLNIGDITFNGGDFDGNGVVNSKDIEVLSTNWLSYGDL
ncbi:MAG: hypothetical protein ABFD79_08345, partial [Phycisphaerales bacterium]